MSPRSGLSLLRTAVVLGGLLSPAAPFASPGATIPITTKSEDARKAYLEGRDLFERLRFADARDRFQRAVELDPSFALALLQLANTQPSARLFNETIAQAKAASAGASKGEQMLIDAGVAGGQGDNATQLRILKELTAAYPKDERAHVAYGNALFGTQDWADAIATYDRATKLNASYSPIYNQLGYANRFLGRMDAAEKAFRKYIELIPDDPNPYDSYAELLLKLGRYQESITNYKKALGVDPHFVASYVGMATDFDLLRKPDDALAQADALMAVAKDDGQRRTAIFTRAVSCAHKGDFAAAAKELWRQYEVAAATGDTLSMVGDKIALGTIALEQADADGAGKLFRDAGDMVEHATSVPAANRANQARFQQFLEGRVALARNDVDGARKWSDTFATAANASGNTFQKLLVHELRGQVAMAEKKYDAAIAELAQSNLQDPYNLYRLSVAYAAAGKAAEAKQYAAKARGDNTLNSLNYAFVLNRMNGAGSTSSAQ